MKIKKGQRLKLSHRRKGIFTAIAFLDFDSEEAAWFPVAVAVRYVKGQTVAWRAGEEIPCRASLVETVEVL